ncbi:glycosyltransferase family 2 protein [Haloglomus litoreum]|uniref:glycosyltransferase family 2 protein n=1 Tax=Haloglomus litoreum TaxID=3034026 RepID=UPI0023E85641|nr:glycosyltransferase family A protein [Haloglomus sp. DT116]
MTESSPVPSADSEGGTLVPRFTVFTPTYERADVLNRPFESLCEQSHDSFEWVVVDDNSADGTADLVKRFADEAPFPVQFRQQDPDRPGKHRAFALGLECARGEFFLPLDADDCLVPDALETLERRWREIPPAERETYAGVTGLCVDQHDRLIGDRFPESPFDSTILDNRYRHGIRGEKAGFVRTAVLRKYGFPDIDERFVPESLVWDEIATAYRTRYVNDVVRVYWQDDSDDSDQLTALDPATVAAGHARFHRRRLEDQLDWFWDSPLEFCRSAVHYGRFSRHEGRGILAQLRQLDSGGGRLLCLLAAAPAVALYLRDRVRHGR